MKTTTHSAVLVCLTALFGAAMAAPAVLRLTLIEEEGNSFSPFLLNADSFHESTLDDVPRVEEKENRIDKEQTMLKVPGDWGAGFVTEGGSAVGMLDLVTICYPRDRCLMKGYNCGKTMASLLSRTTIHDV